MSKIMKFLGTAAVVTAIAIPSVTSAAVNLQDFEFTVNDKFSDEIRAGEDVDVGFSFDVNGGDEVEFARIRLINTNGDIVESVCRPVGRVADANDREFETNVDTKSDVTEGVLDVQVALFGMPGTDQSNNCDLDNLLDDRTYENRLFVQEGTGTSNDPGDDDDNSSGSGSNSGSGTGGSGNDGFDFDAFVAKFCAKFPNACGTAPAPSAVCAQLTTALIGTQPGVYNSANAGLQSFLMSHGGSIPALQGPSPVTPGFYGTQTANALWQVKQANHCI